jgi:hypothetical protein
MSPIPPEITNASLTASDGTDFVDHTAYGKTDNDCKPCHKIGDPAAIDTFMHNVAEGGLGPNCITCHDIGGAPKIDTAATERAIHGKLNKNASTTLDERNKPCWACHGNGSQPAEKQHPERVTNPYICEDCHKTSKYGALVVERNRDCKGCHKEFVPFEEPTAMNTTLFLVSHYAKKILEWPTWYPSGEDRYEERHKYCKTCHDKELHLGKVTCEQCHTGGHHQPEGYGEEVYCYTCHKDIHDTLIGAHRGACDKCHIKTIRKLQYRIKDELHHEGKQPPEQPQQKPCEFCHENIEHHGGKTCVRCHLDAHYGSNASNLECVDCHYEEGLDISLIKDEKLNNYYLCMTCHPLTKVGGYVHEWHKDKANCDDCHKSHKLAKDVKCDDCHTMITNGTSNAGDNTGVSITIPHMDCKSCHEHYKVPIEWPEFCGTCHGGEDNIFKLHEEFPPVEGNCEGCHKPDLHYIHSGNCIDCHRGEKTHIGELTGKSGSKECIDCHDSYSPKPAGDCRICHKKQEEKHCPNCHGEVSALKEPYKPLKFEDMAITDDEVRLYFKDYSNDVLLNAGLIVEINETKKVFLINMAENMTRKGVAGTYLEEPYRINIWGEPKLYPYSTRSTAVPRDLLLNNNHVKLVYTYRDSRISEYVDISIPQVPARENVSEGEANTTVLVVYGSNALSPTDIEAAEKIQKGLDNKSVYYIVDSISEEIAYRSESAGSGPTLFLNAHSDEQPKIKPILWNISDMREFDIEQVDTRNINMPRLYEKRGEVEVRYHEAVLYDRETNKTRYYTFKTNNEISGEVVPEAFVEGDKIWVLGKLYTIVRIDRRLEELVLGREIFNGTIGLNEPIVYKSLQIELIEQNGQTFIQFHDPTGIVQHEVQTMEPIYFKDIAVRIKENGKTVSLAIYNNLKEVWNGGDFDGYIITWRKVDPNNVFASYSGHGELVVNEENYNRVAQYGAIYGIRINGKGDRIGPNIYLDGNELVFITPEAQSYKTETYKREVKVISDKDFDPKMNASQVYIVGGPAVNEEWDWLTNALEEKGLPGFILKDRWYTLKDHKPYLKSSLHVNGTIYTVCAGINRAGTYRSVMGSSHLNPY